MCTNRTEILSGLRTSAKSSGVLQRLKLYVFYVREGTAERVLDENLGKTKNPQRDGVI
jgi:hypothetical protein